MFGKLLFLFIFVPLAELYLFMTLGSQIGFWKTISIIIATGILGAALTKSQGRRAVEKLQQATMEGRLPASEALDGVIILIAGAVLITPGFLTDAIGFLLLIAPVRSHATQILAKKLKGKVQVVSPSFAKPEAGKSKSTLDNDHVIDV